MVNGSRRARGRPAVIAVGNYASAMVADAVIDTFDNAVPSENESYLGFRLCMAAAPRRSMSPRGAMASTSPSPGARGAPMSSNTTRPSASAEHLAQQPQLHGRAAG
ncbi:MAG: hypothetical protein R3F11_18130 [Verrucomicrobiales bacterium]